jgi:two-component system, chemotaxis family, chemotaxis protein CheY
MPRAKNDSLRYTIEAFLGISETELTMAKILLVDDNETLRARAARFLAVEGFTVVEAESADQAMELFTAEQPDVILMDVSLAGKSGIVVLREMRAADPAAKAIMITAQGQESLVLEAVRAGAKDYVVKPLEKDRLISVVRKLLGVTG